MFSPPAKRRRRTYTIEEKLNAIDMLEDGETQSTVASVMNAPESTVRTWWHDRAELRQFSGCKKQKTMGGQGRNECIPFADALAKHMTRLRDDEEVRTVSDNRVLVLSCIH